MAFFEPGCPGKVDFMPEQTIGRWAMIGAFVETRSDSKIVTNENGIPFGVLEGLQDGSGLSPRDSLFARGAAKGMPKVFKVVPIRVWKNAGKAKATSAKHWVAAVLPSTPIPS